MNRPTWYCWFSFGLYTIYSLSSYSQINMCEFSDINDIVVDIHAPIIANKLNSETVLKEIYSDYGGAFKVDSARKSIGEGRFIVTLTGDIPQSSRMSMDGYAIVACHEFGHILGGEPRQKREIDKWSSVEGQADYFATNECMWNYVDSSRSSDVIHDFNRGLVTRCDEQFGKNIDKVLGCLRIMSGIQAMVDYFNRNVHENNQISISGQDLTEVPVTLQKYPSAQCRVDTWVAGLFDKPRPRCWFKE